MVRRVCLELHDDVVVEMALFTHITNSHIIIDTLKQRNTDYDFTFLNANLILHPSQIAVAAHKTLSSFPNIITPTLHSELVFNISGTTNITQSYKRFGVTPDCDRIVVVIFHATEEKWMRVRNLIQGEEVLSDVDADLDDLNRHFDRVTAAKYYGIKGVRGEGFLGCVLTAIACHNF